MSIRTIIEINHDYLGRPMQLQTLENLVARVLRSSDITGQLNQRDGRAVDLGGGIRVLAQRHHSEALKLEVS